MITHNLKFRPRARLVAVLGEHLISDQAVGLIELVKNGYDADATEVAVELSGLADPATTTVTVRDNGCGMSLEDITDKWLCPRGGAPLWGDGPLARRGWEGLRSTKSAEDSN